MNYRKYFFVVVVLFAINSMQASSGASSVRKDVEESDVQQAARFAALLQACRSNGLPKTESLLPVVPYMSPVTPMKSMHTLVLKSVKSQVDFGDMGELGRVGRGMCAAYQADQSFIRISPAGLRFLATGKTGSISPLKHSEQESIVGFLIHQDEAGAYYKVVCPRTVQAILDGAQSSGSVVKTDDGSRDDDNEQLPQITPKQVVSSVDGHLIKDGIMLPVVVPQRSDPFAKRDSLDFSLTSVNSSGNTENPLVLPASGSIAPSVPKSSKVEKLTLPSIRSRHK